MNYFVQSGCNVAYNCYASVRNTEVSSKKIDSSSPKTRADAEGPERKNGASEKPLSKAINNSRSDGIELKVQMKWLRNNRSG